MNDYPINPDYANQLEDLTEYIIEYAQQNGIDPSTFIQNLDGKNLVDIQNDPAFQTYFQYASMMLAYLWSGGEQLYSMPGEVEWDEQALIDAYNNADEEMIQTITQVLMDDPELMAFYAMQVGGLEDSNDILALLSQNQASQQNNSQDEGIDFESYINEEAREAMAAYGLQELEGVISTMEGLRAYEANLLMQIAEDQQMIPDLLELYETGEISLDEYNARMKANTQSMEAKMAMFGELQNAMQDIMEIYSNLIEQQQDMQMAVINNLRPV